MKGSRFTTLSILFILVTLTHNVIAKDLKPAEKNTKPVSHKTYAFLLEKINACLSKCQPEDFPCPTNCVVQEAYKDPDAAERLTKENRIVAQGMFCMVGCETTRLCHKSNDAGQFLRLNLFLIQIKLHFFQSDKAVISCFCEYPISIIRFFY